MTINKGSEETVKRKRKTVTKGQENEVVTKAQRQILNFSISSWDRRFKQTEFIYKAVSTWPNPPYAMQNGILLSSNHIIIQRNGFWKSVSCNQDCNILYQIFAQVFIKEKTFLVFVVLILIQSHARVVSIKRNQCVIAAKGKNGRDDSIISIAQCIYVTQTY